MLLKQVFGILNFKNVAEQEPENSLLPARHFQDALVRERLRSDRSGSGFSLLTLTFEGREPDAATWAKIISILEKRVRTTDIAGRLGPREIGVILPYTEEAGAKKLGDDLLSQFKQLHRSPGFRISAYPTLDTQNQQPTKDPATPAEEQEVATASTAAQPLEMLFVKKLPVWKRAIDIVLAAMGLLAASPVLIAAAAAIKLTSRGPVIFAQRRDSAGGRPFLIYKFRTMYQDAERRKAMLREFSEQDGPAFKMKNDPRVTSIGRFLRSTSIDELPQLWNVLIGDMTLVGPRPLPVDESRRCDGWQRRRLDVTPGLTCIWQVRGRSAVTFAEWMRMDLEYIRTRSLAHDLKLIVQTVPAVVLRRGAC